MSTVAQFTADTPGMDTFVLAGEPDRNHSKLTYAVLQLDQAEYLLWWDITRIPSGATIENATLYGYTGGDWTGSRELSVAHCDGSWDGSVDWNHRPGITGAPVSVTHSPSGPGVEYAFDVTTICSNTIHAGTFHGFKVRMMSAGDAVRVFQRESTSQFRWRLQITWSGKGSKPSNLSPAGIVGVPKPLLSGFPKDTQAIRAFLDPSETGFGSPAWESDAVDVNAPELDLNLTSFPGGPDDTVWWWIASSYDGKNWSELSDPLRFTIKAMPALTITSPAADNPIVTDASFPVTWDFPGLQKAHHVYVTATDGKGTVLWDNKKQQSTDRSVTVPNGVIKSQQPDAYRVWVEVFPADTDDRVAVPGANVYQREAQVFSFVSVPGVPPMTLLQVSQPDLSPYVYVHTDREAGTPDQLNLWRNNELILDGVNPTDVDDQALGGWTFVDTTAVPWRPAAYNVQPVVNGSAGPLGPTQIITPQPLGAWLTDYERRIRVRVLNEDPEALIQATSTNQANESLSIGAQYPVTITSAVGRLRGTIQGFICDDVYEGNRTAGDYESDLEQIKNTPATPVQLSYQNKSMPVEIGDVVISPMGTSTSWQRVTMTFKQVGPASRFDPLPGGEDYSTPLPDFDWTYGDGTENLPLTTGLYGIATVAGSPKLHAAARIPGHTGTFGWSGGSITRAIGNAAAFTDDVYFTVPSGGLGSGSSLFTVKNPGSSGTPYDVRLRSGGTIDIKCQDNSIGDTAELSWAAGRPCRASLVATWEAGLAVVDVYLYLQGGHNGEDTLPADTMHAEFACDEPVNLTHGNPSGAVQFERERYWNQALYALPVGLLPPEPPLLDGIALELGDSTQTTLEVLGYSASYFDTGTGAYVPITPTDLVGLNRSASSSMTSPTPYTAAARDANGWRRWSITGLTANQLYYWQLTVNGTARGPVIPGRTDVAVGSLMKWGIAISACKQSNPSSPAVGIDIAAWSDHKGTSTLGDNGYSNELSSDPLTHHKHWASQHVDVGRMAIAAAGNVDDVSDDHDTNAHGGISNLPNYNDPVTATSLAVWEAVKPARMDDGRSPRRDKMRVSYKGNLVVITADCRTLDRTDSTIPVFSPTDASQTMFGSTQRGRIIAAVQAAAAAHRFVLLLIGTAWNGYPELTDSGHVTTACSDKMPAYMWERTLMSNAFKAAFTAAGSTLNMEIGHSDSHACQYDDGTHSWSDINGIRVHCSGPIHQNVHAKFGPDAPSGCQGYQEQWPSNAGAAGRLPSKMAYGRWLFDNTVSGQAAVTWSAVNCTPKDGAASVVLGPHSHTYTL